MLELWAINRWVFFKGHRDSYKLPTDPGGKKPYGAAWGTNAERQFQGEEEYMANASENRDLWWNNKRQRVSKEISKKLNNWMSRLVKGLRLRKIKSKFDFPLSQAPPPNTETLPSVQLLYFGPRPLSYRKSWSKLQIKRSWGISNLCLPCSISESSSGFCIILLIISYWIIYSYPALYSLYHNTLEKQNSEKSFVNLSRPTYWTTTPPPS